MADGLGGMVQEAGLTIPSFAGANVSKWALAIGFGILIIALGGFLAYLIIMRMRYNQTIVIFKKIGGITLPATRDKACIERVGMAGDVWIHLRRTKKVLPRPKLQISKNTYWFYEREDGELINFVLKDVDEQMKTADVYYVDEEMRLMRIAIEKNLKDRFLQQSWWQKYGTALMTILFLVIVTVLLVLLFREIKSTMTYAQASASASMKMAEAVDRLATRVVGGAVPV